MPYSPCTGRSMSAKGYEHGLLLNANRILQGKEFVLVCVILKRIEATHGSCEGKHGLDRSDCRPDVLRKKRGVDSTAAPRGDRAQEGANLQADHRPALFGERHRVALRPGDSVRS